MEKMVKGEFLKILIIGMNNSKFQNRLRANLERNYLK